MSIRTCGLLIIFVFVLLTAESSPVPNNDNRGEARHEPRVTVCTANATRCWSEGQLLHSDGRCYAALTRGPCPEGQWWLLRSGAGQCATLSCPPDARSRQCRRRMQRTAAACPRRPDGAAEFAVHLDPAGDFRCGVAPGRVDALHALMWCTSLPAIPRGTPSFTVNTNGRQCAQDNQGQCVEAVGLANVQPGYEFNVED